MTWLLDCDGVVWLAEQVIRVRPGGRRACGPRYPGRAPHEQLLSEAFGPRRQARTHGNAHKTLPTSSPRQWPPALLLEPGERALSRGPGNHRGARRAASTTVTPGEGREMGPVDAVVVGMYPASTSRPSLLRPRRFTPAPASSAPTTTRLPDTARDAPRRWSLLAAVASPAGSSQRSPEAVSGDGGPRARTDRRGEIVVGDGLDRRRLGAQAGGPLRARAHRRHAPRPRQAGP